jgi:hypothetical protein
MSRLIFVFIGLAFLAGCGPKIEMLTEPVSISGKLTAAGAPVGNVLLTLNPIEQGYPLPMQVGADGSFSGKAVPGKYVYAVSAKEDEPGSIDKVPAKYRDTDLTRTITVTADQSTIDIALD